MPSMTDTFDDKQTSEQTKKVTILNAHPSPLAIGTKVRICEADQLRAVLQGSATLDVAPCLPLAGRRGTVERYDRTDDTLRIALDEEGNNNKNTNNATNTNSSRNMGVWLTYDCLRPLDENDALRCPQWTRIAALHRPARRLYV